MLPPASPERGTLARMAFAHPADVIADEHRKIARMVDVLSKLAERVDAGQNLDRADLESTVQFFRNFVDLGHHEKEESVLIPELVRAGADVDEPLATIRADHNQERYLMRALRHSSLQNTEWSVNDQKHFVSIARELVALQRAHLSRESATLLPLLRTHLPAERFEAVHQNFGVIDAGRDSSMSDVDLEALIERVLSI
jgi:hemerythrin-like domain-containing protein